MAFAHLDSAPTAEFVVRMSENELREMAVSFASAPDQRLWKVHNYDASTGQKHKVKAYHDPSDKDGVQFFLKKRGKWGILKLTRPDIARPSYEQLMGAAALHHAAEPQQRPVVVRVPTAPGQPVRG